MKRFYGIVIVILLVGALLAVLRVRDQWLDGALHDARTRSLKKVEPRWPDLSRSPHARGSVHDRMR